jgi:hypothetical protein
MIEGHVTRNKLIQECASIARSQAATPADRKDARNMILLLVGAADFFFDQHGDRIVCMGEAIRAKACELGMDHPKVARLRISRDHQLLIEDLLEGRGYEAH